MATSAADVINLDLEDSVAPNDKPQARANVVEAIGVDWGSKTPERADQRARHAVLVSRRGGSAGAVRRTPRPDHDPEGGLCRRHLRGGRAGHRGRGRRRAARKKIAFEVIIRSAAGIAHVEEIAASSPRLQAMSLGAADFAASITAEGNIQPENTPINMARNIQE